MWGKRTEEGGEEKREDAGTAEGRKASVVSRHGKEQNKNKTKTENIIGEWNKKKK